jgi:hypothetical protein
MEIEKIDKFKEEAYECKKVYGTKIKYALYHNHDVDYLCLLSSLQLVVSEAIIKY